MLSSAGRYTGVIRQHYGVPIPVATCYRPSQFRYRLQPDPSLIGQRRRPDPWWAWGEGVCDGGKLADPAVHLAAAILADVTGDREAARFAEEFVADWLIGLPYTGWILTFEEISGWFLKELDKAWEPIA